MLLVSPPKEAKRQSLKTEVLDKIILLSMILPYLDFPALFLYSINLFRRGQFRGPRIVLRLKFLPNLRILSGQIVVFMNIL